MTAYRIVDRHSELGDVSGTLSHQQIDLYVNDLKTAVSQTFTGSGADPAVPFIVVNSGSHFTVNSRKFQTGSGITIQDDGPGGFFTVSVDPGFITASIISSQVWLEPVSGTVDGQNTVFFTRSVPSPSASLHLYHNGLVQMMNVDYTLTSGSKVTFFDAPRQNSNILASYYK